MSVRRRASIAGLDFKNDFTYQSAGRFLLFAAFLNQSRF